MMRPTRAPQEGCGGSRVPCRRRKAAGRVPVLCSRVWPCCAPRIRRNRRPPRIRARSSHRSREVDVVPQAGRHRRSLAQHRQVAAALSAGRSSSSTTPAAIASIARGNVEIYYNNYILTADQVVYDQSANTLTAVGNVVLKERQRQHRPRRSLHADRRLPRRLRAVAQSITTRRRHAHRRRAGDAARRQHDRVHQRPLHALQKRRRHAALVVHERRP